jgi:hypothetical protein
MSKPLAAVKSSGEPLRVTVFDAVCVPLFGRVWIASALFVASSV